MSIETAIEKRTHTDTVDLRILAVSCWLLMAVTFSMPDREDALAGGSFDKIALLKLAARGIVAILLTWRIKQAITSGSFRSIAYRILPVCIFVTWAMISVSWSSLRNVSFAQASSLATLALMAILTAGCCRTKKTVEFMLKQLSVALSTLSCLILFCYFFVPSLGSMTRNGTGLFHATNTAATASLGLICLVSIWLIWNYQWSRWLLWTAAPHGLVIVLSANRLCLGINTIVLLTAFYLYGSRLMVSLIVSVICCITTIYILIDPTFSAFASVGNDVLTYASRGQNASQLSALSGRAEMWEVQWNSFLESPVIGHGYFVTSREGQLYVWYNWANYTAHNLVLQVLVTTGTVGLVLFLFGLVYPYVRATNNLRKRGHDPQLGHFLGITGIWYLGWSLMNESITGPVQPESVFFFVLLGLALGNTVQKRDRQVVDKPRYISRRVPYTSHLTV